MRAVLLLCVVLVAGSVAIPTTQWVEPRRFYHDAVGFELAAKVKAAEEVQVANLFGNRDNLNEEHDRIVGGAVAPANAYPFLGGLLISFVNIAGQSVCGSSLLSPNRLVTAAHCWFDGRNQARQFEVVLGSQFLFSGGTRMVSSNVILHPQWTTSTLTNDIAMIYLPASIWINQNIQPIALPPFNQQQNSFAGSWATAAGFGLTSDSQGGVSTSTQVSHVNLQIISMAQCVQVFGPAIVRDSTLCTSGTGLVGICGGDSGGPLVVNLNGQNTLVGISSFVNSNGCQLGTPSGFARVTSFLPFINQHLW